MGGGRGRSILIVFVSLSAVGLMMMVERLAWENVVCPVADFGICGVYGYALDADVISTVIMITRMQ